MQPFIENNNICYDETHTKKQGVEKSCFGMSG